MLLTLVALLPLALATTSLTQARITQQILTMASNNNNSSIIGNPKTTNNWHVSANNTLYDLTRSGNLPTTSPKTLPMQGRRQTTIIEPSRSALVIIDMQNFFLHPELSPHATLGRAAVGPTLDMIRAFRANGMKVLWVNWGIDGEEEVVTLPPALLEGFARDHSMGSSFCSDMGCITEEDGTVRELGGKLCRGAWNARPWGELGVALDEGLERGTDLYFHKSELLTIRLVAVMAVG